MSHKVKIAARLRPRLPGEVDDGGLQVIHSTDGTGSLISVPNPRDPSQVFKFPFTSCYDEFSAQHEIFENDVRPLIDVVYTGVTVTIFAYGVTSSGKTHTMQGTKEQPGVIPRVVDAMFARRSAADYKNVSLSMSYFEIHKDEVYDLLSGNRAEAPKLPVRENDVGKVFVANLSSEPVESVTTFNAQFSRANKQRSVGATNLNNQSSRSHAILTIEVTMPDEAAGRVVTGKINLVDLAGSENNKLTGNDPSRMAESASINKSLSVLGQVVHALNTGASRIPYRNSKLTRILQDALGGQSVGLLICNLAPSTKFRQDTLNTLNFAVRTKNVENKPVINERDTRPVQKPHFAAVAVKAPRGPAANIPTGPLPPIPMPARDEVGHDEVSPLINAGGKAGGRGRRPSLLPQPVLRPNSGTFSGSHRNSGASTATTGMSEAEMDEKIKRLVEAEVTRRMEDMMERERAEKERGHALAAARMREAVEANGSASMVTSAGSASASAGPSRLLSAISVPEDHSQIMDQAPPYEEVEPPRTEADKAIDAILPPGALTPTLLQRHKDLDNELMTRLSELERKVGKSSGDQEVDMASALSPVRRKKTGRAYVMLARGHSDKGDMPLALEFYRKAEKYVPDNVKLKERIMEIEWCIKEGRPYNSSPKPEKTKKGKSAKTKRSSKTRSGGATSATPITDVKDEATADNSDGGSADDDMDNMDVEARASPSPPRQTRSKKKSKAVKKEETPEPYPETDTEPKTEPKTELDLEPTTFGTDSTNSPGKRHRGDSDEAPAVKEEAVDDDAELEVLPAAKRTRTSRKRSNVKVEVEESDEELDIVRPRRSKRTAAAR